MDQLGSLRRGQVFHLGRVIVADVLRERSCSSLIGPYGVGGLVTEGKRAAPRGRSGCRDPDMLEGAQHIAQPRRTTNKLPAGKPTRSSLAFAGIQHVQESALGPHSCTVAILLRSLLSQSRHQRL